MFEQAAARGIVSTVGITVTSRNIHELEETIARALLAGADRILLNRFMPGGRGLKNRHLELTIEQVVEMLDTAESVLKRANRFGSVGTELPLCIYDQERYTHLSVGSRCSAAKEFFVVGPSGHIRVCNHSPKELVHIDQLDTLKDHPYWQKFVLSDYLPEVCITCHKLGHCDGGCRELAHVLTGKVDAPDPLCLRSGD